MSGFDWFILLTAGSGAAALIVAGVMGIKRKTGNYLKARLMIAAGLVALLNLYLWLTWPTS